MYLPDNRSVGGGREMDPGIRYQIRLELCQIDIELSVEPERCCQGGNDLRDESIQVGVRGSVDVEVSAGKKSVL